MKMLTHYLQIIGALTQFSITFPTEAVETLNTLSNPVSTINNSLDCEYAKLGAHVIDLIYVKIIFALLLPILFIVIYIIATFAVSSLSNTQ